MILVTGAAGFIGYHLCKKLLDRGGEVVGLDNLNDYYDPRLKQARILRIENRPRFAFHKMDLCDRDGLKSLFDKYPIEKVCHLAAQVGVRYSLANPFAYQKSNIEGFLNVIDLAKDRKVANFVYASSSSVYGGNAKIPFSTDDPADRPISFYGVTKRANELTAAAYHHDYGLPTTGLRFFTVYGPWGRPDMAPFIFTRKILAGEPIDVYSHGKARRDFTYIDDIVQGVELVLDRPRPRALYNIGNGHPEGLERFIEVVENCLGRKAVRNYLPEQMGEMQATWADIGPIQRDFGYRPTAGIEKGIPLFIEWYRDYYKA
ncbi:MAG: NAD-dependent epimerase/dehydratase family protein [Nitrospinae bacterium]|nr:NAD-dependent epimerase/dehydratase family protein [Nitrospinota bacterium]